MTEQPGDWVANASTVIAWDVASRVAMVRYETHADLTALDGAFLVDALNTWIGNSNTPFGVLADAKGLHGTDGPYRARASAFFRAHRDTAFIALVNTGPVIHVIVEMFRIGTGIQLKTFATELAARGWLRHNGIAA